MRSTSTRAWPILGPAVFPMADLYGKISIWLATVRLAPLDDYFNSQGAPCQYLPRGRSCNILRPVTPSQGRKVSIRLTIEKSQKRSKQAREERMHIKQRRPTISWMQSEVPTEEKQRTASFDDLMMEVTLLAMDLTPVPLEWKRVVVLEVPPLPLAANSRNPRGDVSTEKYNKRMHPVGLEPTLPKEPPPKDGALTNSAKDATSNVTQPLFGQQHIVEL
ncbi:hypothetical protein PROFUN_06567 [Planoprotostelium fungivorum]|uniref:Uncharacterized protein n=1 Tax=Planoprotostelium fungivorum TaxID=1890364 RepID=A0A2P6MRV5_9EUKA|nr:hypothetical protein PROFUN_06567 [Planoprotostelium fungivorum]